MKQSAPLEPSLTLVDVQLAFAHWRQSRAVRGPTPERLQLLAVGLLTDHNASSICSALGINSIALKQWVVRCADKPESARVVEQPAPSFIALAPVEQVHDTDVNSFALLINLPNGVQVQAQGVYTLPQVLSAVSELGANT